MSIQKGITDKIEKYEQAELLKQFAWAILRRSWKQAWPKLWARKPLVNIFLKVWLYNARRDWLSGRSRSAHVWRQFEFPGLHFIKETKSGRLCLQNLKGVWTNSKVLMQTLACVSGSHKLPLVFASGYKRARHFLFLRGCWHDIGMSFIPEWVSFQNEVRTAFTWQNRPAIKGAVFVPD